MAEDKKKKVKVVVQKTKEQKAEELLGSAEDIKDIVEGLKKEYFALAAQELELQNKNKIDAKLTEKLDKKQELIRKLEKRLAEI